MCVSDQAAYLTNDASIIAHANTALDGPTNCTNLLQYYHTMAMPTRGQVHAPVVFSVKHGTAASTRRTLCSTARLLILSHEPVICFSGLRLFRDDQGKVPSAPSNGEMVLQLKA